MLGLFYLFLMGLYLLICVRVLLKMVYSDIKFIVALECEDKLEAKQEVRICLKYHLLFVLICVLPMIYLLYDMKYGA